MNVSDQHLIHHYKFHEENNLEEFLDHNVLYVLMLLAKKKLIKKLKWGILQSWHLNLKKGYNFSSNLSTMPYQPCDFGLII